MPKKQSKKKAAPKKPAAKPALVPKMILFPADWLPVIDETRGKTKLSDFVRQCVLARIDSRGLSDPPGPGRPWPKNE